MSKKLKVRVYHGYYGCDTGCCGHYVELEGKEEEFTFEHNYSFGGEEIDNREWAIELAKEVIEKRWPECIDSIDWDSIEIDEISED